MKSLNKVLIAGRLGAEPEIYYFENGNNVTTINIACNYAYQKDGEWHEHIDWIKCKAFGKLGERIQDKFNKGDFVIIEGNLKTDTWEDEKGNKRSMTYVNVRDCMLVPRGKSKSNNEDTETPEVDEDDVPF